MAYSQNDPRWQHILLGFNTSSQFTIGTAGCYVTAIANVCRWAGNDLTPQQINDICKQNNWFVDGGLITRDDIPALLCSNLAYAGRKNWTGPTDMGFFNDASDPNVTYIILIDASHAPGIQTHYTMVWSKPNANDLEIDDSWDGLRKALSHYGSPSAIIQSAMKFVKVAPVTPAPETHPYTIEAITPKEVVLNKTISKWGLNYDNLTAIQANPEGTGNAGDRKTVVAILHHNIGYNYYLEDANVASGWNVLDCDDYTPPVVPPTPYIPPAAPVSALPAKKYTVVTTIMYFSSAEDAIFHKDAKGTLAPQDYFDFGDNDKAKNLGKDNMTGGSWINVNDNVAPVSAPVIPDKPEDWKATFTPFPDGKSRRYIAQRDMYLPDLSATDAKGINVSKDEPIPIYGSVKKGSITYLIPRLNNDTVEGQTAPKEHYYGIPTTSVYTGLPNMRSQTYIDALKQAENDNRIYRKSVHHETTSDKVYYTEQLIARAVSNGVRFINDVIPIKKLVTMFNQKEKK